MERDQREKRRRFDRNCGKDVARTTRMLANAAKRKAALTFVDVQTIRHWLQAKHGSRWYPFRQPYTQKEIAAAYGVRPCVISSISCGKTYRWIPLCAHTQPTEGEQL